VLRQQVEALAAPAVAPPPTPSVTIDGDLGFTFRDELLGRYAPGAAQPHPAQPLVQDFSADFSPYEARPLAEAAQARSVAPVEPEIEQTPAPIVAALVQIARITSGDVVYNLGCGDGRLLVSAASKHGPRSVGIDSRAASVEAARDNMRKARLQRLVSVETGDPLKADVSPATVVFLTLGARDNVAASGVLQRLLRPGTRIVTHQGGLPGWQPAEERIVHDAEGHAYRILLWRIPEHRGPGSSIASTSGPEWDE
jgi:hypothetical protein